MSDNTCCYVIAENLLHRWQCFLLTRWRRLLQLSSWVNWACLLPECVMFMPSAVLVTLRFKRIASIRVISQPYALQNGASVRWQAACRLHAPLDAAGWCLTSRQWIGRAANGVKSSELNRRRAPPTHGLAGRAATRVAKFRPPARTAHTPQAEIGPINFPCTGRAARRLAL